MAGYSGTPLAKKLGIKEGYKVLIIDAPEYYWSLFSELPPNIEVVNDGEVETIHFIHLFTTDLTAFERNLTKVAPLLKKDGLLWISWPKKSAKIPTTVDKWAVMRLGQAVGLVDVKVAAVDDSWSGLKFVYRKEDR